MIKNAIKCSITLLGSILLGHAGTVTSAGTITDLTPEGFGSGTDIADLDANKLGQEGFVLFNSRPEGENQGGQVWDDQIVDNKPAYISNLDGGLSTSSGGWANYDDVTVGGENYNTGGIVLSPGGGVETELFRFTVGAGTPTDLRIGLIADNSDSINWDATNIRIAQDGGGTANQDVDRNGGLDLVQFDITDSSSGEIYIIYATSASSGALIGGITFDGKPDLSGITDPNSTDGDSLGDNWENFYFGDLTTADNTTNSDTDGLSDLEEWNYFLSSARMINPLDDDTDSDTLSDDAEVNTHDTDPTSNDSDSDDLPDGYEILNNLDPNLNSGNDGANGDPDLDTLDNITEFGLGTHPNKDDTDEDGYKDSAENNSGFWFNKTSTGTDPLNPDTDGDGIKDGLETPDLPFDAANPTTQPGTDPNFWDTDEDGAGDNTEITNGTDPTNPGSIPAPSPNVLSADFQGIPGIFNQDPILMEGGTRQADYLSGTWNALDITGHDGTDTDPSWTDLVNAQGNATNISFNITGIISSWTNASAGTPVFDDYLFVNAGNADQDMEWNIAGLFPNRTYKFFPYGGIARDLTMTVDTNGDSDLNDETPTRVPPKGGVEFTVTSDATGKIIGTMTPGNSGEANWGGFEIVGALPGASGGELAIQTLDYDGEDVFLTWNSTPGVIYTIEASTNLNDWTSILADINGAASPATTTSQLVDSPAETTKFYRVVQQ